MKLTRATLLQVILLSVFSSISFSVLAQPCGCKFVISLAATETSFDGAAKGVKPGDKICFTSGTRTGIGFKNIHGTKANPVIITNMCDGKVILSAPSNWGNAVETLDSDFFRFTGSGNPAEEYGIEIQGAQQGINLHQFSNEFEVDHLNVNAVGSCGIVCKTDPTCDPLSWRGAFLLKNLYLHHNKISNTGTEGFYIGNSHYDGGVTKICNGVSTHIDEHDVDNVEVAYNIITNTGNEGLQVGSTTNAVAHHNIITNAGALNSDPAQANNMQAGSGTRMTAYNNIMNGSKGYGVVDTGGGGTYYNNIMMNNLSGAMQLQDVVPNWCTEPDPVTGLPVNVGYKIFNNTFINNKGYGVWMYSENPGMTYFYNNIIVGQGETNYKYVAFNNASKNKWTESNNTKTQDITTLKFLDATNLDFRLLLGSPAIDAGKDVSTFAVNFDYDEKTRPKGSAFDIGAYEFQPSGPTSKAGPDQNLQLPTNSIILAGSGTSITGITGYTWTKKSGPACVLANDLTSTLSVTNMLEGIYVFELQVVDASGLDFDQVTITVLPVSSNQNPVAKAGVDQSITLPASAATFNGIGTDVDGTIASYAWIKVSGPTATLGGAGTKDLAVSGITTAGTYVFQLTVKDDKGASGSDQANLVVAAAGANQLPICNAGPQRTIFLPASTLTITATASDPDGSINTIIWSKKSGGAATLGTTNSLSFSPTGLALGTYVFRLDVADNKGGSAFSEVTVKVLQANQPPVANAGGDKSLSLPTNFIDVVGAGTDADGSVASYLWTKVSGPASTHNGIANPTLSLTNMVQGSYVFGLTVTDDLGATGYDEMVINVDVTGPGTNEPPLAFGGGNVSFSLPTNQTNLYGSGFDPDGSIAAYSWMKASGGPATLTNANKATLSVSGLTAGQYSFRLTVTDDKGFTDDDFAIVTVSDLGTNISPVADAGADKIVKLPQNSVVLGGSGTDQDGQITGYEWSKVSGPAASITAPTAASTSITGMVEGEYNFRLMVTDDKAASDANDVIVRVVSATSNMPPIVSAGADANVFLPAAAYTFADASASDDGTISGYLWLQLSGPGTATLNNPTELALSVKDLVQGEYSFQLTVTDNSSATVFDIVKVFVLPGSFAPPTVDAGIDRVIAFPGNSVDLTGTAAATNGAIISTKWTKTVGPAATLAGDNSLTLNVTNMAVGTFVFKLTAGDNTGKEVSDNVQVIVEPVPANKPPVVTAGINTAITLPANQFPLTGTAVDADGTVASVKWTQTQGPTATIQNGTTLAASATGLVAGNYVFKLAATDNLGAIGSSQVIVAVVEPLAGAQAPIVAAGDDISVTLPQDTVSIVGTAFDPDGSIGSFSWDQVSGEAVQMNVTQGTILQLSELALGTYSFALTVTDDDLMVGSDTVKVFVIQKNQEIPKFFSPNNDGIGDVWVFRNVDDYTSCKLVVFSRAGQVVYEANPYQNNWDGTHNGKFLAGGDYYYSLNCTDASKNLKGALRIIR